MIGFGEYGKKRELGIVSTDDARLVLIDPTSEGFFEDVLGYATEDKGLKDFIEAIKEVKEAGVGAFWKPIYDPSLDGEEVVFKAGSTPAVWHSYNFWKQKAEEMATVQDRKWSVGSEYQYYAFLVWMVNSLEKKGWTIEKALNAVVLCSKELGHYTDSKDALYDFEKTGSREVCGVYDLGNIFKMLSCTNEEAGGFWLAGGNYGNGSNRYPLADLSHNFNVDTGCSHGVGWLVLS